MCYQQSSCGQKERSARCANPAPFRHQDTSKQDRTRLPQQIIYRSNLSETVRYSKRNVTLSERK
ncbi:conserved hypothetical protein [Roseibium sp. TrichSKD4]|nr:conserved hypothetical protein [Roseibium sp. TrichSKD4]